MTTPAIRSALEQLVELDKSSIMEEGQWAIKHENAIADAIAALAAEPVGEGPSVEQMYYWALKAIRQYGSDTLSGRADGGADDRQWQRAAVVEMVRRAQTALDYGSPAAPAAPEAGEVAELVDRLGWIAAQLGDIGWSDDSASVACAATLLQQLAAPAPAVVPVPVADDRDPECVARWPECVPDGYDPRCCRFPKSCSCAHAIPLPQAAELEGPNA